MTARGRWLAAGIAAGSIAAGSTAIAQAAPEAGVTMAGTAQADSVRYGEPVRITGVVAPARAGGTVELQHAAAGRPYRRVAATETAADGSYRFAPRARRSGSYRAVSGDAATSEARRVTVVAALRARTTRHALGGRSIRVRGTLLPRLRGRRVMLQLRSGGRWRAVDSARTNAGGRFSARVTPRGIGTYRLRVRFAGGALAAADGERLGKVHSYRAGTASWYGPGLYGNALGCGGTLTAGTLGVAHKTLPCGTRVSFRYRGRSVTVPVVDRGPYVGGREWDLTAATRQRLGFGSTGTVYSTR